MKPPYFFCEGLKKCFAPELAKGYNVPKEGREKNVCPLEKSGGRRIEIPQEMIIQGEKSDV